MSLSVIDTVDWFLLPADTRAGRFWKPSLTLSPSSSSSSSVASKSIVFSVSPLLKTTFPGKLE